MSRKWILDRTWLMGKGIFFFRRPWTGEESQTSPIPLLGMFENLRCVTVYRRKGFTRTFRPKWNVVNVARAFERSRCRGGRFAWFDRAIAMSQNKIGVSRKMSIEYPYKQLPCQTQGGFLQTALSAVTRRSRSCSSPVLLRRVTPDRVLASGRIYPLTGT